MPRLAATVLLLLAGTAARGQAPAPDPANLRGDQPQTRKRLAEADQKRVTGNPADVADDLQRVLDEAGDDLVTFDNRQYQPARAVAHQILAKLPADVLKGYRDRIDEPARQLLDAGKRDRDPRPLWQLLDRYFVSRPAGDGLLLLGELLFERGEFRTAELLWRRLLPDADADLPYPSPGADPAAVRARVVLAAIFAGEAGRAQAELAALKAKHPGAAGPLAGKAGPYAETLQAYLDRPPRLAPGPGGSWPTFAGGPDRDGSVPGRLPRHWPSRPTWVASIPGTGLVTPGRAPFGHPVVVGGRVYVADGARVLGFDLRTGLNPAETRLAQPAPVAAGAVPCFTLSAAGDRLYARAGSPVVRAPDPARKAAESGLVCLTRADAGPGLRELWRVPPPAAEGRPAGVWEGAPLAADGRMWAAFARSEAGRTVHAVACYDPADPAEAPDRPAWVAEVCDSPLSPGSDGRARQELLTRAGRHVVFCSNGGAVVAVDAATGRRAWGFRYPRSAGRAAEARPPDPAPCAAAGGRVFVAPADADRVFALDAETGRLLWESGSAEGVEVLGVGRNTLVAAVAGPVRGVRGWNAVNGSDRDPGGWAQHAGRGLLSGGRGLVSDDLVLWPTREGLEFLHPADGTRLRSPLPGPPGNLAYADGVLVAVTTTQVLGFVSDARAGADTDRGLFERYADGAERALAGGRPDRARKLLLDAARDDLPPRFRAWAAARLVLLAPPELPADVRALLSPELCAEWVLPPDGRPVTLGALAARHTGQPATPPARVSSLPPADPKPEPGPGLRPKARVIRARNLPAGSFPLRPIPGAAPPTRLFVAAGPEVLAVPISPGEPGAFAAADPFTHAAEVVGGFVAAGPSAVALYGSDRRPGWVFRVPDTDPLPATVGTLPVRSDVPNRAAELSSFVLAGDVLYARVGDDHLIRLDLTGRRVGWVLGATGRPRFDPFGTPAGPRFGGHFAVAGGLLVAQRSDGRRWLVRADTGRVVSESATAPVGWPAAPAEVGPDRLAVSDGPGLVRLLTPGTGKVRWTHDAGGAASLTGEPPRVRTLGEAVLVAVRRNHGVDLDRLDPLDGRSVWPGGPAFLDADRVDLAAADADPQRLYVAAGGRLRALDADDGSTAWEADLPEPGEWAVRTGRKVVIAYPAGAVTPEPLTDVWGRVRRSFAHGPHPLRLPGLAETLYDAWVDRTLPVLLFDPETGKLVRRLDLPARGPVVAAHFGADAAVVVTGGRVVWFK